MATVSGAGNGSDRGSGVGWGDGGGVGGVGFVMDDVKSRGRVWLLACSSGTGKMGIDRVSRDPTTGSDHLPTSFPVRSKSPVRRNASPQVLLGSRRTRS